MRRFIFITAGSIKAFQAEIEAALDQGYEPYGNIAIATTVLKHMQPNEYFVTFMRLNDDIWEANKPSKESK